MEKIHIYKDTFFSYHTPGTFIIPLICQSLGCSDSLPTDPVNLIPSPPTVFLYPAVRMILLFLNYSATSCFYLNWRPSSNYHRILNGKFLTMAINFSKGHSTFLLPLSEDSKKGFHLPDTQVLLFLDLLFHDTVITVNLPAIVLVFPVWVVLRCPCPLSLLDRLL